jgi:2'-deoxynucleoside 5'-phosphate N-hydrolase
MAMRKIYFAGSIRGGRTEKDLYSRIIAYLQQFGEVLTEHIGSSQLDSSGEAGMTDSEIYSRDLNWLLTSDVIVADVTVPSLGVGFEIAKAAEWYKRILCLYRNQHGRRLSAMISGCPEAEIREYETFEDVKRLLDEYFGE